MIALSLLRLGPLLAKAFNQTDVVDAGIVTLVRRLFWKALAPMVVVVLERVSFVIIPLRKALDAILVAPSGIFTSVRRLLLKELVPIVFNPFPNVILATLLF